MTPDPKHSRTHTLARAQAISGLVFLVFTVVHLTNTALATLGPALYNGFQRALRPLYQHPLVELTLIIVPLLVHLGAGITRMRTRRGQTLALPLRTRLHRYAGWFLMLVIVGHISATRGPALLYGIYPEFEGVAWSFVALPAYFYPYYVLLGVAGVLHAWVGGQLAAATLGLRTPAALRKGAGFWLPVGVAGALVVLGVLSVGGLVFEVPDPSGHPFARFGRELLGL